MRSFRQPAIRHFSARRSSGPRIDAVERARQEERARTQAWLHDHTLQLLEYIAAGGYDDEVSAERLRAVAVLAADGLRQYLEGSRRAAAADLAAALRTVIAEAQVLAGSLVIEFAVGPLTAEVASEDIRALTAATCEALNNVRKHGRARRVVVACEATADGAVVTIRDDGAGFAVELAGRGIGLRHSIVGRMLACGGSAHIESAPGDGTLITLRIGPRTAPPRLASVAA